MTDKVAYRRYILQALLLRQSAFLLSFWMTDMMARAAWMATRMAESVRTNTRVQEVRDSVVSARHERPVV